MAITVKYGDSGTNAKIVQQMLNRNGYSLDVDGIIGDKTLAAIKDYQQKNGLAVDGIVGDNTWSKLAGENSTYTTTPATNPNTTGANNTNASSASNSQSFNYEDFTYDDFTYDDYKESQSVKDAGNALNTHLANKPGEYQSQWQTQLDELMNSIMNRDKFSYNFNEDALYQQYKDKFIQQGKMAMGDAIGQASAMTGGYGNSYAQSVGQQMYQKELQNLNDVIPELYQMALDKYNMEGQDLYNQYGMVMDRENLDYSRYRDTVSDYLTERDYLAGRYDSERDYDYSKYVDDRNFDYGKYSDDRSLAYDKYATDKSLAYQEYRNAIEDDFKKEQFDYQKDRDRISDEQWQKQYDLTASEYAADRVESNAKNYYETEGKLGYDNGSLSDAQIKEMQKALGITVDGKWGPGSTEAADGLTADQAWKAYQDGKLGKANISYDDVVDDLDYFISQGAVRSEINSYLNAALKSGYISQEEYNTLKKKYVPQSKPNVAGSPGGRIEVKALN